MFRNQYDHDVSIWSPQGRIHQIEYAMEAVKQGTASIALKNEDYAVIIALKRAPSELSSYQEKIIHIDDHIGVAISGLTADGHLLSRSMRRECVDNRWAYDEPLPVSRMLSTISLKMQIPTQRYGRRPFGVGMIVVGFDAAGPHVYYLCPSSNAYDCKCIAIGSRSQSARTYLERNMDQFPQASLDDLILHGFKALQKTLPNELSLTLKNCSLAIVGKGMNFTSYEDEDIEPYLKKFEASEVTTDTSSDAIETPMEQDQPAYVTSTQYTNWHFTASEIVTLRIESNASALKRFESLTDEYASNRTVGLDVDQELKIVKRYVFLMRALFDKFTNPQLPNEVYGYAVNYFKRFYLKHSVMDFYPRDMMLTCLYVACKVADFPIGIQTFVSHIPRNQDRYGHFILNSELFLLESLGYDLWVFTPYKALVGFIVELIAYQKRLEFQCQSKVDCQVNSNSDDYVKQLVEEMRLEGFNLINLWFQTDLCLAVVHPSQIALAVLVELGRSRPQFDVEVFVRDELCGCDSMDKSKSRSSTMKMSMSDDEDGNDNVDSKSDISQFKVDPEIRWRDLSSRLDYIRQTVEEFQFITSLEPIGDEERILDQCRNPLYDLDSDEYAEAKAKSDSLIEMFE